MTFWSGEGVPQIKRYSWLSLESEYRSDITSEGICVFQNLKCLTFLKRSVLTTPIIQLPWPYLSIVIAVSCFAHPQKLDAVIPSVDKDSELILLLGLVLCEGVVGTERHARPGVTECKEWPCDRHYLDFFLLTHFIDNILENEIEKISISWIIQHRCKSKNNVYLCSAAKLTVIVVTCYSM